MKDFNFFDELRQKKKAKTSTSTYVAGVAFTILVALGVVSYVYLSELNDLNNEKAVLENSLNEEAHKKSYEEALSVKDELLLVENEAKELEMIHAQLLDSRIIDNLLIKEIAMAKPEALAITSISFSKEGINIAGTSINKDLIARFEHNLRANERFTDSFIPVIQKLDKWTYTFTMSMAFSQPTETLGEEANANGEGQTP